MSNERPVIWMGSSRKDLKAMSDRVRDSMGFALRRVQMGEVHPSIEPLSGRDLRGVREIRIDADGDTYRAVYVASPGDRIYVLHVFKKKSHRGIATPKRDVDVIRSRLRDAGTLAKELDG